MFLIQEESKMKMSEAMNLTCPFGTVYRDKPVYCGCGNCMAWVQDGSQLEDEYLERVTIFYGHCKLIEGG
jgi:hypothetical protein